MLSTAEKIAQEIGISDKQVKRNEEFAKVYCIKKGAKRIAVLTPLNIV